jgi:hypothetical protein
MSEALLTSTLTSPQRWGVDEEAAVTGLVPEVQRAIGATRHCYRLSSRTPDSRVWRPFDEVERPQLVLVDLGAGVGADFCAQISLLSQRSVVPTEATESTPVTLEASRPAWWDHVEERFAALRDLPANWNGYGAAVLDSDTINRAAGILASLVDQTTPEPSVVPAVTGGVQIEWHTLKADLEMEFQPSGETDLLFTDVASGLDTEPDDFRLETLRGLVRRLTP